MRGDDSVTHKSERRAVKAAGMQARTTVIQGGDAPRHVNRNGAATSNVMPEDPFAGQYGGSGIIEPPYNLEWLSARPDESNILPQCIQAMACNVEGFGYTLEVRDPQSVDPDGDGKYPPEVDAENAKIRAFFDFCNPVMSYDEIRRRTRIDLESTGNAFWEIVRDGKGEPCWIEPVVAYTMRLTKLDDDPVEVMIQYFDAAGKLANDPYRQRFRRFVQERSGRKMWFKQFGDPRRISSIDGHIMREDEQGREATEIIHFKLYNPATPYGVPRWIGNLPSLLGSRISEEINLDYLNNGTIPPLALLVSGILADDTIQKIQDFINAGKGGSRKNNKILLVEARPAAQSMPGSPPPKAELKVEHLSDAQQKDALFVEYDKGNRDKIRSAFRLPPIYIGQSEDYTKATADESKKVAEEQVFAPERTAHDFVINRLLFPAMGVKYWRYKTLSPARDDTETLGKLLPSFAQAGMTVRECRDLMKDMLHRDLKLPEGANEDQWLDLPMAIYLAQTQGMQGDEGAVEKMVSVLKQVNERMEAEEDELY